MSYLGGDGGLGKTTLAFQLAYCTTWGMPWLGNKVRQGAAIYFTAEETNKDMNIRFAQLRDVIVMPGRAPYPLEIISRADEDSALLAIPSTKPGGPAMHTTPLFEELMEMAHDLEARLIVLDAVADVFGGEEISRSQVRCFIQILRRMAFNLNCAIMLIGHPSVDGMKSQRGYSGSTHWNNGPRSRLYLTTPDAANKLDTDKNLRLLERAKANNAPRGTTNDAL